MVINEGSRCPASSNPAGNHSMQPRYDEVWQDGNFLENALETTLEHFDASDSVDILEALKGLKTRVYRGETCIWCGLTVLAPPLQPNAAVLLPSPLSAG